jgi:hypothetical protein
MQAIPIILTANDRVKLTQITRAATSEQRMLGRARIILLAAENISNSDIGSHLTIDRKTVGTWRNRFDKNGFNGLNAQHPENKEPRLRLTALPGGICGLSFCSHSGKWERTPFVGSMQNILDTARESIRLAPRILVIQPG